MVSRKISSIDLASLLIVLVALFLIGFVLWNYDPGAEIYVVISLIGSVASTGGLLIAILQIIELRKTTEATRTAVTSTEKELSIMRSIESATNCFNQMNQIDEYLETNNVDSIKTLLPIATKNFHEMIFFDGFDMEVMMSSSEKLGNFLEDYAGQLTIMTNHRNTRQEPYKMSDEALTELSKSIQQVKTYANMYKTKLQQAIVKDNT